MITTLPHSVTIIHPGTKLDRYNNTVADWDGGTTEEGVPGWVQHRSSTVNTTDGRSASVGLWVLYVNADVAVADGDRVTWDGRPFEVDGEPHLAIGPAGVHHVVVNLKTVDG